MNRHKIEMQKVSVTTTGADGAATGNTDTDYVVQGKLYAVYLDYNALAPGATTDVTISHKNVPSQVLLTVANNATDGWYFPRAPVHGPTGTGLTYDGTRTVNEPYPVCDFLNVAVAQCDALANAVIAYLFFEVA